MLSWFLRRTWNDSEPSLQSTSWVFKHAKQRIPERQIDEACFIKPLDFDTEPELKTQLTFLDPCDWYIYKFTHKHQPVMYTTYKSPI